MNFEYSYRAFLITSLLFGCLILLFMSIKLSGNPSIQEEYTYDITLVPEEISENVEMASTVHKSTEIETNRAYNEADRFISEIENENKELARTIEEKLQEMEKALEDSRMAKHGELIESSVEVKKRNQLANPKKGTSKETEGESGNRNTTLSYRLVDRKEMYLPNPVYTCYGSGRVVINIEVDKHGNVKNGSYNNSASTTSNQCLIDAAMEYALQARFNAMVSKEKQLGTITYNFPGQE